MDSKSAMVAHHWCTSNKSVVNCNNWLKNRAEWKRLQAIDPKVNPIVKLTPLDTVLSQALESTIRYASGTSLGPFDGIPITVWRWSHVVINIIMSWLWTKTKFLWWLEYHNMIKCTIPQIAKWLDKQLVDVIRMPVHVQIIDSALYTSFRKFWSCFSRSRWLPRRKEAENTLIHICPE